MTSITLNTCTFTSTHVNAADLIDCRTSKLDVEKLLNRPFFADPQTITMGQVTASYRTWIGSPSRAATHSNPQMATTTWRIIA